MKKILLSVLFGVLGITIHAQTGCSGGASNCALAVANSVISITSSSPYSATQCQLTLTIEFDLSYNSGNKDIFIHSWLAGDYPNYFPCSSGTQPAPTNTILGTAITDPGKSFLDIGLDNSVARGAVGVPVTVPVYTTYNVDPTVVLISTSNSPSMTVTKTFISGNTDHVIIKNVIVVVNTLCTNGFVVKTDVWSRNGTNSPAQCWVAGIIQGFDDPKIAGFKNCDVPCRKYTLGISTTDPAPTTLTYSVYIDMNDNGSIDGGDFLAVGPNTFPNFSSSNSYSSGGPVPYTNSCNPTYANHQLIVKATTPNISNDVVKVFTDPSGCIGLPVDFKSFTATRNHSNVLLKWETSTEKNNTGFAVERNTTGSWEQVAWVVTQAPGGNSNDILSYSYNDLNNVKGVSQYRIRQVDFDARSKYSEIRSVRGENQAGQITVYPNPSSDGKINIVFENGNVIRDVSVIDMNGRTVKLMKGVTSTSVTVDNLVPGMYTVRVVVPSTGDQTVEKIVVNKH